MVNNTDSGVKLTGFEFHLQDCVASGELGLPLGALVFSLKQKRKTAFAWSLGWKQWGVCVCVCVCVRARTRMHHLEQCLAHGSHSKDLLNKI